MVVYLQERYEIGVDRGCSAIQLHRSMWYYQSKKDDSEVIDKLNELAQSHPTRGFDEYYGRIRQQGYKWNRKRVLRVYRLMKLGLRRKRKKRIITRMKTPLVVPERLNQTWSMDFMSDSLSDGRRVRTLNIIDDCNREALAIEAGISFPSQRVVRVLCQVGEERGFPNVIRVDNGPEFIAHYFQKWCKTNGITIQYTQPGKPMQNGFIERFNRFFREDILDAYWFEDLGQLRILADKWRYDYNHNHPHKSLGGLSPVQYKTLKHKGTISSQSVKAKMNDSLQEPALTDRPEIVRNVHEILEQKV